MKLRTRWLLALLLLAFLLLGSRLVWTLGVSADSWRLFADQWIEQTRSLVKWEIPVPYRTPSEQAAYWVQQSQEIEAAQNDPQVALGAAWMLDTPDMLYEHRHYYTASFGKRSLTYLLIIDQEWERETVKAMANDFEPLAREACLKQSELATQLDPENKQLWRNRALLLFQISYTDNKPPYYRFIPRLENWQAVLAECVLHDSGNALYDYLAAIYLSSISSQKNEGHNLIVLDPRQYEQALQRLEAGTKKPFLNFGYTGEAATFAFLSHTSFLLDQQNELAESRESDTREQRLLVKLLNFVDRELMENLRQKSYDSAISCSRDFLKISQQLSDTDTYFYFANLKEIFELNGLKNLLEINKANPGVLDDVEQKKVLQEYSQSLQNMYLYTEILNQTQDDPTFVTAPSFFQSALLLSILMNLILILLLALIITGVFSWISQPECNSEFAPMGLWRPLVCWLLGTSISFVLWGLFPAQIVPLRLQYYSLWCLHWTGYTIFILGILYLIHARFSVPWSELFAISFLMGYLVLILSQLSTLYQQWSQTPVATIVAIAAVLLLFGVVSLRLVRKFFSKQIHSLTVSALICGLVLVLAMITVPYGLYLAKVDHIPINLMDPIQLHTWRSILEMRPIVGIPEDRFDLYQSSVTQVWLIWYWLAGELFAVILTLSLLSLWYLKRQSRSITGGFSQLLQTRKRGLLSHAVRMLAKSCAVAVLLFSLIYLAVAPGYLKPSQAQMLKIYRRLLDTEVRRNEIENIQAKILTDKPKMEEFRQRAKETTQQLMNQKIQPEPSGEIF